MTNLFEYQGAKFVANREDIYKQVCALIACKSVHNKSLEAP